jgi:hypothetical protein
VGAELIVIEQRFSLAVVSSKVEHCSVLVNQYGMMGIVKKQSAYSLSIET